MGGCVRKPEIINPNEVDSSHFKIIQSIGRGGYAIVFLAQRRLPPYEFVAVKRLDKHKLVFTKKKPPDKQQGPWLLVGDGANGRQMMQYDGPPPPHKDDDVAVRISSSVWIEREVLMRCVPGEDTSNDPDESSDNNGSVSPAAGGEYSASRSRTNGPSVSVSRKRQQKDPTARNHPKARFHVHLLHAFQDPRHLFLVLPFMSGGDFQQYMKTHGTMKEAHARFYIAELISAMEFLHYNKLVYRDLKPRNLLFDSSGHLRLSDFGLCRKLSETDGWLTTGRAGTKGFQAPEVLNNRPYSFSCDFFSLGVTLYRLLSARRPFGKSGCDFTHPMKMSGLSDKAASLIRQLCMIDPHERLGCTTANYSTAALYASAALEKEKEREISPHSTQHFGSGISPPIVDADFAPKRGLSKTRRFSAPSSHLNSSPFANTEDEHLQLGPEDEPYLSPDYLNNDYNGVGPADPEDFDSNDLRSGGPCNMSSTPCIVSNWDQVKHHPFFSSINWHLLDQRQLQPPHVPNCTSLLVNFPETAQLEHAPRVETKKDKTSNDGDKDKESPESQPFRVLTDTEQKLFEGFEFNTSYKYFGRRPPRPMERLGTPGSQGSPSTGASERERPHPNIPEKVVYPPNPKDVTRKKAGGGRRSNKVAPTVSPPPTPDGNRGAQEMHENNNGGPSRFELELQQHIDMSKSLQNALNNAQSQSTHLPGEMFDFSSALGGGLAAPTPASGLSRNSPFGPFPTLPAPVTAAFGMDPTAARMAMALAAQTISHQLQQREQKEQAAARDQRRRSLSPRGRLGPTRSSPLGEPLPPDPEPRAIELQRSPSSREVVAFPALGSPSDRQRSYADGPLSPRPALHKQTSPSPAPAPATQNSPLSLPCVSPSPLAAQGDDKPVVLHQQWQDLESAHQSSYVERPDGSRLTFL